MPGSFCEDPVKNGRKNKNSGHDRQESAVIMSKCYKQKRQWKDVVPMARMISRKELR